MGNKKVKMVDEKETPPIDAPEIEKPEPKPVQYVAVGVVHGNNKKVYQPGQVIDCLDGIDLKARIDDGLIREVAE